MKRNDLIEWCPKMTKGKRSKPHIHCYCRVSSDRQVKEGHSLDDQEAKLQPFQQLMIQTHNGVAGVTVREEGQSAYRKPLMKRPGALQLFKVLRPGDHIVFTHHDRCFRNLRDFLRCWDWFEQHGVTLHFMNVMVDGSTAIGQLILRMMVSFAEYEAADRGERVMAGKRKAAEKNGSVHWQEIKAIGAIRRKDGSYAATKDWAAVEFVGKLYVERMNTPNHISYAKLVHELERWLCRRDKERYTKAHKECPRYNRYDIRRMVQHYRFGINTKERIKKAAEAAKKQFPKLQKAGHASARAARQREADRTLGMLTGGNLQIQPVQDDD